MSRPVDHRKTKATPLAKTRAIDLRHDMSLPEVLFWKQIKSGKLDGMRFRRQHPIGQWIADFYCHEYALVVEIDGSTHAYERKDLDAYRDQWMLERGIRVVRIPATEVLKNMPSALRRIRLAVEPE